jgi:hypothetical protein
LDSCSFFSLLDGELSSQFDRLQLARSILPLLAPSPLLVVLLRMLPLLLAVLVVLLLRALPVMLSPYALPASIASLLDGWRFALARGQLLLCIVCVVSRVVPLLGCYFVFYFSFSASFCVCRFSFICLSTYLPVVRRCLARAGSFSLPLPTVLPSSAGKCGCLFFVPYCRAFMIDFLCFRTCRCFHVAIYWSCTYSVDCFIR